MPFMARLQCAVSHYSELNVVIFIWAKFSWVLKTHFPSRWNAFSCSSVDSVFLSVWNSRYSHFLKTGIADSIAPTECQKSYCFGKEIMRAVWKSFSLFSYSNSFIPPPPTFIAFSVSNMVYSSVLHEGPYNCKYIIFSPYKDTVFTESSQ